MKYIKSKKISPKKYELTLEVTEHDMEITEEEYEARERALELIAKAKRSLEKAHIFIITMKTKEQKERNKNYMREYHDRPEIKVRHKKYMKDYNSKSEVKLYQREYQKKYSKKPSERAKKIIRMQSQRIYGKVPEGYERHHINYDSPHNFILIPLQEHKEIHEELNKL